MSYCKWCSKEFAVYDELGAECYSCWQVRHRLENMTDGVVADLVEKNAPQAYHLIYDSGYQDGYTEGNDDGYDTAKREDE